jgi:hypothetical protein
MPTQNRRDFISLKAKREFRKGRTLVDPLMIQEQVVFAGDYLENITVQRKHLCEVFSDNDGVITTRE